MPEPSYASQRTNAALREPIINLVRFQPGRAFRGETTSRSPWALAPIYKPPVRIDEKTEEKGRLHFAISVLGAAQICGRDLAYQVADAPPDLAQLSRMLATDFKHAEKVRDEDQPKYLFNLPEAYGEWGRGVLLASAIPQNFPWLENPAWTPISASQVVNPTADEWRGILASGRDPDPIAIFQAPAPAEPRPWIIGVVRRHRERNPTVVQDRGRVRHEVLRMVEREKERLVYLARWYPEFKVRIPEWMTAPDAFIAEAVDLVYGTSPVPAPRPVASASPAPSAAPAPSAVPASVPAPTDAPTRVAPEAAPTPTPAPSSASAPSTPSTPAPSGPVMVRGAARRQGSQTSPDQSMAPSGPSYVAGDLGDKDF